jgi:hypothetical protein
VPATGTRDRHIAGGGHDPYNLPRRRFKNEPPRPAARMRPMARFVAFPCYPQTQGSELNPAKTRFSGPSGRRRERTIWLADDVVPIEPVWASNLPANREIYREFSKKRRFARNSGDDRASKNNGLGGELPRGENREINQTSRELNLAISEGGLNFLRSGGPFLDVRRALRAKLGALPCEYGFDIFGIFEISKY